MSEIEDSDHNELRELFIRALLITGEIADALIADGFTTLEEIAYVPRYELKTFTAVDEVELLRIRKCARTFVIGDW